MDSPHTISTSPEPAKAGLPVAGSLHTAVFLLILFATVFLNYYSAGRMRAAVNPDKVLYYLKTIAWEWLLMGYVLLGVRWHRTPLAEVTGAKWKSIGDVFLDIGIAFGFWFGALIVLTLLAHLLRVKPDVRFLTPEGRLQVILWILISISAGICEETVFRGYLQKQFIAWTGSIPAGVLLSALAFGAGHIYQGVRSAVVIAVYGLMFGVLAQLRHSMRPGMITHSFHDIVSGLVLKLAAR